jgi:uncharacterized protein (TIGR03086 family)
VDAKELYRRSVAGFLERVDAVGDDQWDRPTPCVEWDVHDLVNHVVAEDRWAAPLLHGRTIDEVGTALEGDVLGDDPVEAAHRAAEEALGAVEEEVGRIAAVHLSYGDERPDEYLRQLAADHLLHGWDLAVATMGDPRLDPDLVAEVSAWFAEREEAYRAAGVIGPRGPVHDDGNRAVRLADHLLAASGRDPEWGPAHVALAAFDAAMARGDVTAATALLTDDCVLETTEPAPDGERIEGREAIRARLEAMVAGTTEPAIVREEAFVCGERAATRWRYSWIEPDGREGHVRGADIVRFRDGRIAEVLAYVKG